MVLVVAFSMTKEIVPVNPFTSTDYRCIETDRRRSMNVLVETEEVTTSFLFKSINQRVRRVMEERTPIRHKIWARTTQGLELVSVT